MRILISILALTLIFTKLAVAETVEVAPSVQEDSPPALTFSPWTKACVSDTCFVGRDGRFDVDCGPVVAIVFIEKNADAKKTLHVTLPTRVSFERGVRIVIDQDEPIARPFTSCLPNGCIADYDAGAELIDRLEHAQMLVLEATDKTGSPISFSVPLADFASAYEGPPQELRVFSKVVPQKEFQAQLEREKLAEKERQARCQ